MSVGRGAAPSRAAALLAAAVLLAGCAISPARKELAVEWYGVGNAWLAAGKWSEAGKAYDRALRLDPGLASASYNAVRALVEAQSYDRAIELADGLLKGEPDNVRYLSLKAYALWKAGRAAEAARVYEAAYALDPWAQDVVYNSAVLLVDSGEAAKAAERLAPVAEAKPDDAQVLALYARALEGADRPDEARSVLEDLRSLGSIDAPALVRLAGLYEKSGEYAKALDALGDATDKDKGLAAAWFALARIRLSGAADAKAGLENLAKALEAGFGDKAAASDLLSLPGLLERDAVAKLLVDKGLVQAAGQPAPAAGGETDQASGGAEAQP